MKKIKPIDLDYSYIKDEILVTDNLEDVVCFEENNLACVSINSKYGIISRNGEIIIPFIYDKYFYFSDNFSVVCLDYKYGVIDINNEIVIPFMYDLISKKDGLFVFGACLKGFWGVIDIENNKLVEFAFQHITPINDRLFLVGETSNESIYDYKDWSNLLLLNNNFIIKFAMFELEKGLLTPFINYFNSNLFYNDFWLIYNIPNKNIFLLNIEKNERIYPKIGITFDEQLEYLKEIMFK